MFIGSIAAVSKVPAGSIYFIKFMNFTNLMNSLVLNYLAKRAANAIEFNLASTLSPLEDNTLGAVAPTRIAP